MGHVIGHLNKSPDAAIVARFRMAPSGPGRSQLIHNLQSSLEVLDSFDVIDLAGDGTFSASFRLLNRDKEQASKITMPQLRKRVSH